ncbi:leucine-rich repeat domain-containing protein [Cerasicoccus fimbriatus]|uniref:leucine-rich repeat domain-containing protein n=1 Tax=Cerasicoccus fimbriatus TaxID=3014554 RepID=UPI0022B36411|nr:leucine-rich repeat domain-containing protein [Cerasicoccus sp. TK19100]
MPDSNIVLDYEIRNSRVTITHCNRDATGEVIIPEMIEGFPVKSIDLYAFYKCTQISNFILPDSITYIGSNAFYGCNGITELVIPDNVTGSVFSAASYCENLEDVYIGEKLSGLGSRAFFQCPKIANIYISASNASMRSVNGVVYSKDETKLIKLPHARSGSFEIPESVTNFDYNSFSDCALVSEVVIGPNLTNIPDSPFNNCHSLNQITVHPDNPNYASIDGVLFNKSLSKLIRYPLNRQGHYNVPHGVTDLRSAFSSCAKLTSITLPEGITEISGFASCKLLSSIDIPEGVTTIGSYTFIECTNLESITLPNSLTQIRGVAFVGCEKLKSIHIPKNVSFIDTVVFGHNYDLMEITVDPDNTFYTAIDNVLFNTDQTELLACPVTKSGEYIIPESVKTIRNYAFYGCKDIIHISLPENLELVENSAFFGCSSLQRLEIPKLTVIEENVVDACSSLISITVDPENPYYASLDGVLFDKSLETLHRYPPGKSGVYKIPSSTITIDDYAFSYAKNLMTITIGESVEKVNSTAFYRCSKLERVIFAKLINYHNGSLVFANNSGNLLILYPASIPNFPVSAFAKTTWESTMRPMTPYEEWAFLQEESDAYPTSELLPSANVDHDLSNNFSEYVFETNLFEPDSTSGFTIQPTSTIGAGKLIVDFNLSEATTAYDFELQVSNSLRGPWETVSAFIPQGPDMGIVRVSGPDASSVHLEALGGGIFHIAESIAQSDEAFFARLAVSQN